MKKLGIVAVGLTLGLFGTACEKKASDTNGADPAAAEKKVEAAEPAAAVKHEAGGAEAIPGEADDGLND